MEKYAKTPACYMLTTIGELMVYVKTRVVFLRRHINAWYNHTVQ